MFISKDWRINEEIRAREVRVVDENGEQVGIVPVREALQMAVEKGLDLVEIAPGAKPPVCRLMDYGKFRYEQSKRIKRLEKTEDHHGQRSKDENQDRGSRFSG